jgi:hypothetical protein
MNEEMIMDALSGIMEKLDTLSMEVTAKKLPGQEEAESETPVVSTEGMEDPAMPPVEAPEAEAEAEAEEVEGEEEEDDEEEKPAGKFSALDAIFAKKPAK